MWPWQLDVLTGLGAGLLFALLARVVGVPFGTAALEGIAFAVMWIVAGWFLRNRSRRNRPRRH